MTWISTNGVQVNKTKTRTPTWFHCQTCRRQFSKGQYKYQWRFVINGRWTTYWHLDCLKCLVTEMKLVSAESALLVKKLSDGEV